MLGLNLAGTEREGKSVILEACGAVDARSHLYHPDSTAALSIGDLMQEHDQSCMLTEGQVCCRRHSREV